MPKISFFKVTNMLFLYLNLVTFVFFSSFIYIIILKKFINLRGNKMKFESLSEIQLLKDRVRELESKLNTLINELGQQTLLVEDKTN